MIENKTLYWIGAANQVKSKNSNREIEQKMRFIMNEAPLRDKARPLSAADKKEIEGKFSDLYFGLAWLNWMQGATLGAAWQSALNQVDQIVQAKTKSHPANLVAKHLQQVAAAHKTRWSQTIMTSENANLKMNVPQEKFESWKKMGEKWARTGLDGLNAKIKAFEPKTPQLQQGNIVQMAIWNHYQNVA